MARLLILFVILSLAACGGPPRINMVSQTAPEAGLRQVFVASNRLFEDQNFSSRRGEMLDYTRFAVSIPPERDVGEITWPTGDVADPQRHFVVTEAIRYSAPSGFRADIAASLSALPAADREVVVFVHGFNNNFASGLFRVAQMAHDYDAPGLVAHFSWPSAGNPFGYAYDRDSVMTSRDALEAFLQDIADAGAQRILLVAHSVGSHLVMESLRQVRISGNDRLLSRLSGVVLISPDIDVDLFRSQARALDPLPQPFVVFTSQRDRVLQLSAGLTGQSNRLGNISAPDVISEFEITLVDISAFESGVGDWGQHSTVVTSPSLISLFQGLPGLGETDREVPIDLFSGTVLTVRNATQILLLPVTP